MIHISKSLKKFMIKKFPEEFSPEDRYYKVIKREIVADISKSSSGYIESTFSLDDDFIIKKNNLYKLTFILNPKKTKVKLIFEED